MTSGTVQHTHRFTGGFFGNCPACIAAGLAGEADDRRYDALLAVYEYAHQLIGVTTHVNVSGEQYADRRECYAELRRALGNPALPDIRKPFPPPRRPPGFPR